MNTKQPQQPGPVHRIVRGKVEAAIWERSGKSGRFFQASFSRPFMTNDGKAGSSENFAGGQLSDVATAAIEAALWMEAQTKPRTRPNGYSGEHGAGEFDGDTGGDEADLY